MNIKLLTEHHLEFLSLEGGCRVSSESTLTCQTLNSAPLSHAAAHIKIFSLFINAARVLGRRRGRINWFMFFGGEFIIFISSFFIVLFFCSCENMLFYIYCFALC